MLVGVIHPEESYIIDNIKNNQYPRNPHQETYSYLVKDPSSSPQSSEPPVRNPVLCKKLPLPTTHKPTERTAH